MNEPESCDLHVVALRSLPEDTAALTELSRSPIGDECQRCAVCRTAREYVVIRLVELQGRAMPDGRTSDTARRKLQTAVEAAKTSMRRAT